LVFENEVSFFEGKPEDYLTGQRTPRRYRNPLLAHAMVALNLIDTLGYGIHRMMEYFQNAGPLEVSEDILTYRVNFNKVPLPTIRQSRFYFSPDPGLSDTRDTHTCDFGSEP